MKKSDLIQCIREIHTQTQIQIRIQVPGDLFIQDLFQKLVNSFEKDARSHTRIRTYHFEEHLIQALNFQARLDNYHLTGEWDTFIKFKSIEIK